MIELLVVIAIIGVLAAITLGVVAAVNERVARQRVAAELGALAAALERYRRAYGDYPQNAAATTPAALLQCLLGRRGPTGVVTRARPWLDVTAFRLTPGDDGAPRDPWRVDTVELLDPWGGAYGYLYLNQNYLLWSAGPDGRVEIDPHSLRATEAAVNTDNLYANPE